MTERSLFRRFPDAARRLAQLRACTRPLGTKGTAGIEFGFIAPLLGLMMVPTFDIGMGLYRDMQVHNAAQAGADYAIAHGYSSSLASVVTGATNYSAISAAPAPATFCGCPSSTGVTVTSCTAMCDSNSAAGTYVTVSASATYNTVVGYPFIPASYPLSATTTVRIQ